MKKLDVIDLHARFGKRCRITYDQAYDPKGRKVLDPWMMQIPCAFGTIYPTGGDNLAVEVDYKPRTAKRLLALGLTVTQNGDFEKTFSFPVTRFEEVAAIVKPRRRRQLSEEQRRRLAGIGFGRRGHTQSASGERQGIRKAQEASRAG